MAIRLHFGSHTVSIPEVTDAEWAKMSKWAQSSVVNTTADTVDLVGQGYLDRYVYNSINDIAHLAESNFGDELKKALDQKYFQRTGEHITCFTKGTLIRTPEGEVAVETLSVGDQVCTLSGIRKVIWLGIQPASFRADYTAEQKRNSYPVHIMAGALGNGIPSREVVVSAWHHIFINNVLVRAMDLVNGKTIFQQPHVDRVIYYHIEFDTYDMISTSGMYSESFSDNGNTRGRFINAEEARLQDGWETVKGRSPRPGFKVVRPGDRDESKLEEIRERLARRSDKVSVAID